MPTWQLSTLPSRPHHCRCTPTDSVPFLGKAEGSKTSTPSGSPSSGPDLAGQFGQQRPVVPVGLADELLQALAFPVVQVGDGLDVLAAQVGQQPLDVVPGVGPLLGRAEQRGEGLEEAFQPRQQAAQQAGRDLGIVEQFVQADAKTSLHGASPREVTSTERSCTQTT